MTYIARRYGNAAQWFSCRDTAQKRVQSISLAIANVRFWHFSDITPALTNVRYRGDCVAKLTDGAR